MSLRSPARFSGFLGIPIFLLAVSVIAGARTFTDAQGRKIEAEITSVAEPNVTLKLDGGKTYTIPIAKLSKPDQLFVSMWKADPKSFTPGKEGSSNGSTSPSVPPGIEYAFDIEPNKKRLKKGSTKEMGNGKVTPEEWIFQVGIQNRARVSLEGLEMSYRIYVDPKATEKIGFEEPSDFFGFQTKLDTMGRGASLTIPTEPVTLNSLELDGDYEFKDGSRNNLKDSLEGIWIKIWHGGKKVAEYKSNSAAVKKAKWADDEAAAPEKEAGQ